MPEPRVEPTDKYGLARIDAAGGKADVEQRDPVRAPLFTGGTITGKAFQTDAVDPRIVLDSASFSTHNTTGQETVKIDVLTGVMSLLYGSGVSANIRWVDSGGVVQGQIIFDSTFLGTAAFTMNGKDQVLISATAVVGSSGAIASSYMVMQIATPRALVSSTNGSNSSCFLILNATATPDVLLQASGVSGAAEMKLFGNTGSICYISVPDATSRLRVGTGGSGGTNPVDFINGNLIFQTGDKYTGNIAGQVVFVAKKMTTTAAQEWGYGVNWRHVRTDTAGGKVTPGSVTFGSAVPNTNASTPNFTGLTAIGGFFRVASTAAGITDYANTVTVN